MNDQPYPQERDLWDIPPDFAEARLGRPLAEVPANDATADFWEVIDTAAPTTKRNDIGAVLLRRGSDELMVTVVDLRAHARREHQEYPDPVVLPAKTVDKIRDALTAVADFQPVEEDDEVETLERLGAIRASVAAVLGELPEALGASPGG